MTDIVISSARENDATVRQLSDALRREGYSVWSDDSPAPNPEASLRIAEQIGRAKAVIVVWSETSAASEWVRAEANVARGQNKLIQVRADAAAPPIPFDPAGAVSLSDWLGANDHPGWLRLREEVAARAGPPPEEGRTVIALSPAPAAPAEPAEPAAPTAPLPPSAPAPVPVAAPPASPSPVPVPQSATPAARPSRTLPLIIALVVLAAILGGGAYAWQRGLIVIPGLGSPGSGGESTELTSALPPGPGVPAPPSAPTPPPPATTAAEPLPQANAAATAEAVPAENFTQDSVIRNARGFALVRSAPDGGGLTLGRIAGGDRFSTYPQDGPWWRVRMANGTIGYVEASSIRSAAQVRSEAQAEAERRRPKGPRINRNNSENMRLFCAGAGAGTPQCRTFQRQIRNQR